MTDIWKQISELDSKNTWYDYPLFCFDLTLIYKNNLSKKFKCFLSLITSWCPINRETDSHPKIYLYVLKYLLFGYINWELKMQKTLMSLVTLMHLIWNECKRNINLNIIIYSFILKSFRLKAHNWSLQTSKHFPNIWQFFDSLKLPLHAISYFLTLTFKGMTVNVCTCLTGNIEGNDQMYKINKYICEKDVYQSSYMIFFVSSFFKYF